MNYAEETDARRRLAILQLLIAAGGKANDGDLLTTLRSIGHVQMMDKAAVRRLLRELEARDTVAIAMIQDTVMVASVLEHGRMAAAGHVAIGGIHSPHEGL